MKNKIIIVLVPIILAALISAYLTFEGSFINAVLSPLTGCGALLGLLNLGLTKISKLVCIILNTILGILIFALLYFVKAEYILQYLLIGGIIGLLTGIINSLLISRPQKNNP
ncbi:hypothetical protein ACR776_04235 [Sphingobacterium spiritivorum]|uniref:Uncharacterized protein n=1 Tax=Sphingobacterium spiritivorum ATCC 33861 TaxID=525373 RepID=D7VGG3_SPHSI|nr:hypothetical protein [Sphingobacterium spiritivorum]EFK60138.1 hypothetical protein HMPREF0766_10082 [Sphingobacterium spiritivorum ATCC 33861]QQT34845.1 hypothetical protein I6J01_16300 [Sphingobacterium spiritivorum]WQD35735.1 hypothetical protein U0038_08250 [Sphingobacterium spiritivorum]SUJ01772.1 Uncharacterised protein [Sphingobacterium spiritivorum]